MSPSAENPYPLDATTPSLGVRVWIEPPQVCLHVANEGGRGVPSRIVFLPVVVDEDFRVKSVLNLAATYENDKLRGDFQTLRCHTPSKTLPTPSTQRYDSEKWSKIANGQAFVLTLVLFRVEDLQPAALGVPVLEFKVEDHWPSELKALEHFFDKGQKPAWVRRGLVCVDAADLPIPAQRTKERAAKSIAPTTFALASCQYPAGLLDGTPQDYPRGPPGPADASMLRLAARLQKLGDPLRPSLLLLVGDQIYADATAGLFDPRAAAKPAKVGEARIEKDWLRVPYQNWLGSVGAQSVLGWVPTRMMLDDHEIDDNWEPLAPPADDKANAANEAFSWDGRESYGRYQRNRPGNTPLAHQWHPYEHRGVRFFMADTRTERDGRKAAGTPVPPRIMSAEQEKVLLDWLPVDRTQPAFVVSPSMLLPRRQATVRDPRAALHSDAWDGYPRSLHTVLAALCREDLSNVVFLSGDEHLSSVTKITVTDRARTRRVVAHSVHSSGLYAPYPFANALPEEFAVRDSWCFEDPCREGEWYRCEVEVLKWIPGDGFACLTLTPAALSGWTLNVDFDRAPSERGMAASGPPAGPATTVSAVIQVQIDLPG